MRIESSEDHATALVSVYKQGRVAKKQSENKGTSSPERVGWCQSLW